MVIKMTEIQIIGKFGKKICEPFTVNTAPEAIAEDEQIINSTEGQDAAIQDTEAAEDI